MREVFIIRDSLGDSYSDREWCEKYRKQGWLEYAGYRVVNSRIEHLYVLPPPPA